MEKYWREHLLYVVHIEPPGRVYCTDFESTSNEFIADLPAVFHTNIGIQDFNRATEELPVSLDSLLDSLSRIAA